MTGPNSRRPDDVRAWLDQEPSLKALQEEYPAEWSDVVHELSTVTPRGPQALAEYVQSTSVRPRSRRERRAGHGQDGALPARIRHQMAVLAAGNLSLSAATGVVDGHVRFNRANGSVAQRLLFRQGLDRKPVSMRWFRLVWPRLPQRRFLMPLVAPQGIYCFYSKALIDELVSISDGRECLEIAAGDGTLSRFLADAGVHVTATDDHSWQDVSFPDSVLKEDAADSLSSRAPTVVLCSWPPAGNRFEREVFRTPSVALYIVIGSRHRFAAGDWPAYESQTTFSGGIDERLSRLVLPPEIDPAVYVFRRR